MAKANLILMDIQLPGMDGLSATRIIREDPSLKDIPVVALSFCAIKSNLEKAQLAGCNGYIIKSIDTRVFLNKVSQFFEQGRPG